MTKEVRDNFDGLSYDEDESLEFTFVDRNLNGKQELGRVHGDISREGFLKLYQSMVKKPKWERWVKAVYADGKLQQKGYWEKIA